MRWACLLLGLLVLGRGLVRAEDDWSMTRRVVPTGQRARRAGLLEARAMALAGRHQEAASAFLALAREQAGSRAALLREAAREWLAAGLAEQAVEALAPLPLDDLQREAYRRAGRTAELAAREERAGRWASAGLEWEHAGDDLRALAAFERARDDHARLRILTRLGRVPELEQLARSMLRRARSDPAPLAALAASRRAAGHRDEALALLAHHGTVRSLPLHRALRELYASWGERALEERELALLITLAPHDPEYRLALADAALARGDLERARAELLRAAALDGSAAREARAAQLLADRDLLAEALVHVSRARELEPGSYLELEASLLERAGRLSEAERLYESLLTGEQAGEARRRLAGLFRRAGTLDAHVAALRTRDDLASLRLLAQLYARDARYRGELRGVLARILAKEPGDREAQRALVQADWEAHDLHAAIARAPGLLEVEQALELARAAPEDAGVPALLASVEPLASPAALAELASIRRLRGESEEARVALERSLALEPASDAVRLAYAELALTLGDPAGPLLEQLLATARSEAVLMRALSLLGRERARPVLLASAHRHAQRRVLLALAEPLPSGVLRAALLEGDERERAQALELLHERPEPALLPVLRSLVMRPDRSLAERAAALMRVPVTPQLYAALPRSLRPRALLRLRSAAGAHELLARERGSHDPSIRVAAELALADDEQLAGWLFSPDAAARARAAEALAERDAWGAITLAAREHPEQLVPYGPGVAPRALIEAGVCPERAQIVAFSAALVPFLSAHVALLVHAGGATPGSLRQLATGPLHALLVELASRRELPPGAAEALRAERPLRDWPERMWATRALGEADPAEPLAVVRTLVRAQAHAHACARTAN